MNADLLGNLDLATQPRLSFKIARVFRRMRLNTFADANDIREIGRRTNGRVNGPADRTILFEKTRTIWG